MVNINVGDKLTIVYTTGVVVQEVHTDDEGFGIDVDRWREFHFPDLNGNDTRAFRTWYWW